MEIVISFAVSVASGLLANYIYDLIKQEGNEKDIDSDENEDPE